MWMPPAPAPAAPAGWKHVPVEAAKAKQPEKQEVFAFGSEMPPWMAPTGFKWQLVEAKKDDKKVAEKKEEKKEKKEKKEKLPEIVLKVKMCCTKCVDKAKEEIGEVPGVKEVKTDRANSKVTVVGKADEARVLKRARNVYWRARVIEVKKVEDKKEEKKAEETKKKEEEAKKKEVNLFCNPGNYYPSYYPPHGYPYPPPFEVDGNFSPSQAYSPRYYETDYRYYNYPNNPHYLTHIKYS